MHQNKGVTFQCYHVIVPMSIVLRICKRENSEKNNVFTQRKGLCFIMFSGVNGIALTNRLFSSFAIVIFDIIPYSRRMQSKNHVHRESKKTQQFLHKKTLFCMHFQVRFHIKLFAFQIVGLCFCSFLIIFFARKKNSTELNS